MLSPTRRDGLAVEIGPWRWLGAWRRLASEIDRINILQATLKAMCHAASVLKVRPKGVAHRRQPDDPRAAIPAACGVLTSSPRQKSIVDGDALVPVISAASIIAKTFRDMLMDKLDNRYPGYVSPSIRATVPRAFCRFA